LVQRQEGVLAIADHADPLLIVLLFGADPKRPRSGLIVGDTDPVRSLPVLLHPGPHLPVAAQFPLLDPAQNNSLFGQSGLLTQEGLTARCIRPLPSEDR